MHNAVPVNEGRPSGTIQSRWIRLVVRAEATTDDREAEKLLQEFGEALGPSDYGDEFTLSIFRIDAAKVAQFGILPKVEMHPGCDGIVAVRRFLTRYAEDVRIPLVM